MMKIRKITACFLSAILLTSACVTVFADAEADTEITVSDNSYAAYSENHSDTLAGDKTELSLDKAVTNGEKNENGIVLKEEQSVAFNEAIPNGKYKIQLSYTVLEVSSETIEFKLSVDGKYPFSERETKALRDFTLDVMPDATISYHSKGEEIYWYFYQKHADRDLKMAKEVSFVTGYPLVTATSSAGGYKDWCIEKLKIPSLTIEVGGDELSHPIGKEHLDKRYEKNKKVPYAVTESVIWKKNL